MFFKFLFVFHLFSIFQKKKIKKLVTLDPGHGTLDPRPSTLDPRQKDRLTGNQLPNVQAFKDERYVKGLK